jgi:hypothetical protein
MDLEILQIYYIYQKVILLPLAETFLLPEEGHEGTYQANHSQGLV